MSLLRNLLCAAILVLLAGCSFARAQLAPGESIPVGHGVLVAVMHSNYADEYYNYWWHVYISVDYDSATSRLTAGRLRMDGPKDLKVVILPEGRYVFSNIEFGKGQASLDHEYAFTISNDTVTYIGDIRCDVYEKPWYHTFRIFDNEHETKQRLA